MIALWHFYWPAIAAGLIIGLVTGKIVYRRAMAGPAAGKRRERNLGFAGGAVIAMLAAGLWHGPAGTGNRLANRVEGAARATLIDYEMEAVGARLDRSPLRRTLILSGPSDDVQQRELVRIMNGLPGVSDVQWANPPTAPVMMK